MENEYLQLGKIINTCGLKGEVKVYSTTFFAKQRYKKNNEVLIEFFDENGEKFLKKFTISSYRNFKGFDYVLFKEIDTIEKAKPLVGKFILIKKIDAKLPKGYYYFDDLKNCKIIDFETKQELAVVSDVKEFTASITLQVKKENDNKNYYIPFIDHFIKKVDIENKIIEILNIKGLLD